MRPTALFGMSLLVVLSMSPNAGADDDADVDATVVDDADAGLSAGDVEEPVGLQPTVFDSNLGCAVANSEDPSAACGPIGLGVLAAAFVRRRRSKGPSR